MRTTIVVALLATLFAVGVTAGPAAADTPGESDESAQLVRQAIALIVNTPAATGRIKEKVDDALQAPKQAGVDLALVKQAAALFPTRNMHQVRALLERSIGAQPHRGDQDPLPPGQTRGTPGMALATGAQTGTDVAVDPLAPDRRLSSADWLGLVALAALAGAGLWLADRFRPRPDDHQEVRP